MSKHLLSGIQSFNNFVFTGSGETIRTRKGLFCDVAGASRYPSRPDELTSCPVFSTPNMLTGVFRAPSSTREQQPAAPPMEPIAVEEIQLEEKVSAVFGFPEEGWVKVYQSRSSLQRHSDAGKHFLAWEREFTYDVIKKTWAEMCKSISGSYMEAAQRLHLHPP